MRKYLVGMFLFAVAYAAGRLSSGVSAEAEEVRSPITNSPSCADLNADGRVDVRDAVYLLRSLFARGPLPVCPESRFNSLPATGQTECTIAPVGLEFGDCVDINPSQPGQDGFYSAGCPMDGRFLKSGDGTVTDNCTGLMWQLTPFRGSWTIGLQLCEDLTLAGHDDWRMPNASELFSLVHYGVGTTLAMDPIFLADDVGPYWSSTTTPRDLTRAIDVTYRDGLNVGSEGDGKNTRRWVRAVRGGLTAH